MAKSKAAVTSLDKSLKLWPLRDTKPRDIQVESIRKCLDAYDRGAEYVILEAPPGVGKSAIGVTLARYYGRTYFTTLTAQLQEQYLKDFEYLGMRTLKGRAKHKCGRSNGDSCLVGKELFQGKNACYGPADPLQPDPAMPTDKAACPYLFSKQSAFNSPLMMSNYHSFLANIGQAALYAPGEADEGDLDSLDGDELLNALEAQRSQQLIENVNIQRPFMVLDEAHVIESFLLDQTGVGVNLNKLGVRTDPLPDEEEKVEPYAAWLTGVLPQLRVREKVLTDAQEKEELRGLIRRIGLVLAKVAAGTAEYIVERDKDFDTGKLKPHWFSIKPLRVHEYGKWLWGYGKRSLFMSATVLDAGQLATNIGLDLSKGDFVQMGSVFPKENRPIVVTPMDMRKSARDTSWPRVAQMIDGLMSHHSREKGLLLCPSNDMLKFFADNVSKLNRMRLIFAHGKDREARYKEHLLSRSPTVLAASGYWEGADLKGDASRFQIIPAAPRPMWFGQIKARSKMDPSWYRWLTFCKLVQGYGRSVRSDTDEAITYIMDQEFVSEMNRSSGSMIPPWMKEAVRVTGQKSADAPMEAV